MARISKVDQAKIRQKIITIALDKFSKNDYGDVSTKEIAKEVGIAEGTLFNYFDSKAHLFLEAFSDQFTLYSTRLASDVDLMQDVGEVIYNHLMEAMKLILRIPKSILIELMIASVKMSKKHPEQFRKFAEIDFKYMAELDKFLHVLVQNDILNDIDTKQVSEIIYSVVMYECIIYLYNKDMTKNIMLQNIKIKIDIIINEYLKGGHNEY